jgi:flagellar biosynthesis/type III secretory pathway protein FliH
LIDWLQEPDQRSVRRAFAVWMRRVLLPARIPGVELEEFEDIQEVQSMLAERVKQWTEEWKQQGLQQGLEQGLERGISQGEAQILRRQLARRFGPLPDWVEMKVNQASTDLLELWADRILDADSLDAVFRQS